MPAAKSKVAESNGSTAKSSTSGTATPVSTGDKKDTSDNLTSLAAGKPDKKVYDAEQERIKLEIDALQVKLVSCSYTTELFYQVDTKRSRLYEIKSLLQQSPTRVMTDGLPYVQSWTVSVTSNLTTRLRGAKFWTR